MKTLSSLLARPKILDRADEIIQSFSASGRTLFYALACLILASSAGLLLMLNNAFLVAVPERGASLSEGIVGSPRFINPVLAQSDADRDMVVLLYSGLLKATPEGEMVPDLAESYDISPDGRTYTVRLREQARFHDNSLVTADDVAFTIQKTLDPGLKSPNRADWQGVVVSVIDPRTVSFTLSAPYSPFLDNLTIGILPKHLWHKVGTQEWAFHSLNTAPIGSGPFRLNGITRTPAGIATAYDLRSFAGYALGKPHISRLNVRFYDSEAALVAALRSGSVEAGSGISPALLVDLPDSAIVSEPLNRVFGVFFNQNNNEALQDAAVRKALSAAIDRSALIAAALGGYAEPLQGPIPPALHKNIVRTATSTSDSPATSAQSLLAAAGWKPGPDGVLQKSTGSGKTEKTVTLSFTLSTSNVPELRAVAEVLAETWAALGVNVSVQVFEAGDLTENVIRPRKYDALLFGEIVGRGLDLFAFWDSSQRNDPGLNIALYANATVDSILAKLRANTDLALRAALYAAFEAEIAKDAPAIFLYAPDFIYVVPADLKGVRIGSIENPSDRFDTIERWYRSTDRVWKVFAK